MIRRPNSQQPKRRGFTLIELLVVISIIAVLMSLILPAIQNAREAGRRTQCLNNLKNLGLAMHNYGTTNRGRLPSYGYFAYTGSGNAVEGHSWVVELLPYLDQQTISDRWQKSLPWNDPTLFPNTQDSNQNLALETYIAVLACPDDASAHQISGGLTYVVNAGVGNEITAIDLSIPQGHNFNLAGYDFSTPSDTVSQSDVNITRDCGMFWANVTDTTGMYQNLVVSNQSQTLDTIYDGAANTIMLTENLNAGVGANGNSWANPDAKSCTFYFPLEAPNGTLAGSTLLNPLASSTIMPAQYQTPFINENKAGPDGDSPFPSSFHPGGVNYCNAEGGAKFLAEDIDRNVYLKLITPAGTKLRGTANLPSEGPLKGEF
jgi:prepilin-type N-terminal cleavage/methylation domain-containing protein